MPVQVIKRQAIAPKAVEREIQRTCCYIRVSTNHEEQEDSFEAQRNHYETLIHANPSMSYAGTYADEGVSGTGTEHREGFKQMLADAEKHMFDQILTKSISRFGRNTVDTLQAVRRLKDLGIGVRFEKEGVWTLDGTGELLLVILSSLAQQESQSISENVKMGIRYRFQEGKHFVNCSRFLGYDKVDGRLVINPEEAATVRRIYALFLNGYSVDMIASQLTREGIPTGAGKTTWYPTTVRYILSNEKYAGDLRLQKTVVPNFLTHRSKRNTGEADQYYVENSHDPIVPRDVFDMAQAEASRRSAFSFSEGGRITGIKYGSRKALSGRCRCGCGALLYRERSNTGRWVCKQCGLSIGEAELQSAVMDSFRKLRLEKEHLRSLLAAAEQVLAETEPTAPAAIQKKGEDMGERAKALFRRFHIMAALDWVENVGKENTADTCRTLERFIEVTRSAALTKWDDDTILKFVEGVALVDGKVAVRFKAGVTVMVEVVEDRSQAKLCGAFRHTAGIAQKLS